MAALALIEQGEKKKPEVSAIDHNRRTLICNVLIDLCLFQKESLQQKSLDINHNFLQFFSLLIQNGRVCLLKHLAATSSLNKKQANKQTNDYGQRSNGAVTGRLHYSDLQDQIYTLETDSKIWLH